MYNINISEAFSWDRRKALINQRKHGVSFEEASSAFLDEGAIEFFDPDHSESEDRYVLLGFGGRMRVLVVCYCYRGDDAIIRIISMRKATKKEEQHYWRLRK